MEGTEQRRCSGLADGQAFIRRFAAQVGFDLIQGSDALQRFGSQR
jgi:hypothetical protein